MNTVIRIIGIAMVFIAVAYFAKPGILRHLMKFFKQGRRIYFVALIRFVMAIVFLLGANSCNLPWVIIAFGVLFILSGLLIFILGPEKIRGIFEWYERQSVMILRLLAAVALVIGALVVYSA